MQLQEIEDLIKVYEESKKEWDKVKTSAQTERKILEKRINELIAGEENHEEISFKKSDYSFKKIVQQGFLKETKESYLLSTQKILPLLFINFEESVREAYANNTGELTLKLDDIPRQFMKFNLDNDFTSVFFITIHNSLDLNVFKVSQSTIDAEEGRGIFCIYHYFCKALPLLKVNDFKVFCSAITDIKEAVSRDMTNGIIYTSLKNFAAFNPSLAEKIYVFIKRREKKEWAFLLNWIILGLEKKNFKKSFDKAINLLKDDNIKAFKEAGILSLGLLDYGLKNNYMNEAISKMETFFQLNDDDFNSRLARSYGSLQQLSNKALKNLLTLSKTNVPEVKYSVVQALFRNRQDIPSKVFLRKALFNLCSTRSKHRGIINDLDLVLADVVDKETELVTNFFEKWQISRNEEEINPSYSVVKLFDSTFFKLIRDRKKYLEVLLTNWFKTDNRSLLLECKYIVEDLRLRSRNTFKVIELSTEVLNEVTPGECISIAKRILGFIFNGKDQCCLVFSILCKKNITVELEDFIYEIFRDRIAYNYPGLVREFMNERKREGNKRQKRIAIKIIDYLNNWQEEKKNLEFLKEVQIPNERRKDYLKARGKLYNKAMEKSQNQSIVSKLATKVPLKYGNSWFTERNKIIQPPRSLNKYSSSMEVPKGELTDPILEQMLRIQFQTG